MAGISRSRFATPTARIPSPFQVALAMVKRALSSQTKRREHAQISALLEMDDRQLFDMGVTRDDVRNALATSECPSAALQVMAKRRRNTMVV